MFSTFCMLLDFDFCVIFSIFFTTCYAAALDIILSWNAWRSLRFTQIVRYLLKFAVASFWLVVLPIAYSKSVLNPSGLVKFFSEWTGDWRNQSFYSYCVAIYLIPNILASLLFFLPHLRRSLERSNWRIIGLTMWWAQASTFNVFTFLGSYCSLQWLYLLYCSQGCMLEEECMKACSHFWSKKPNGSFF